MSLIPRPPLFVIYPCNSITRLTISDSLIRFAVAYKLSGTRKWSLGRLFVLMHYFILVDCIFGGSLCLCMEGSETCIIDYVMLI